ncbi:metallophosphoesterase [Actinobacteria bacterium YIM 96077]|uniref:Metallophosphoesterase n=1 Tax=Phytoactinopolyspora halophila TaxID=1981511 RepID=A0A329QZU6_9ACTN|nr:metallophosphoesterase [Phytoactinopolyspora halophila]AYY11798.1 metallophosphoesterase [Actinobacteria bacterium YIM 96077]RAW17767.1 metallophosphoesterase [Phytoactinopolyspora halophila]
MAATRTTLTLAGLAGLGLAGFAYAAGYEVRSYRLRRFDVPVLAPGSQPLRVLHISDLHLTPGQERKISWVRGLAALEPDLVVTTGDNLAHPDAVPGVLQAYEPFLDTPGAFVFGSNDYYSPRPKNPASYLLPVGGRAVADKPDLPWTELRDHLRAAGWLDLTNSRGRLTIDGRDLLLAGVDDPHLGRDRYGHVTAPVRGHADLTIGVTHAPYLRVLDAMAADGYQLLLAGHTHGGQLCVPGYGALVTNCDLEPARVKGVSRHPAHGGPDAAWMHVSAGLGTSPYAPFRFACPPEATLLTLVAR